MDDEAKRKKYAAAARKAYREGRLAEEQADALREAGVDLFRNQPLTPGLNDLATVCPELVEQWHPDKNGGLTPVGIKAWSKEEVWWRHELEDGSWHEWSTPVRTRVAGSGCPICASKQLEVGFNDLASTNPELVEQWHPDKNGGLRPTDLMAGSERKVWWRHELEDGSWHEWEATVSGRARGNGCPYCVKRALLGGFNDLATIRLDLVPLWDSERNGKLSPENIITGSRKKVWWICGEGHHFMKSVGDMMKSAACPVCSNRVLLQGFNDLKTRFPELADEWHPIKNGSLKPSAILHGSSKKVWWRHELEDGSWHEWEATVSNRSLRGQKCPYCSGRKPLPGFNDLATVRPDLAAQWHPEKNGDLKPADVTAGSAKRVWWICPECGREWKKEVSNRAAGSILCKQCQRKKGGRGRAVKCVEAGETWPSITAAADAAGLKSESSICDAIKFTHRTAGGFHWEYVDGSGKEGESE